jgi:hypothetical protein
MPALGRPRQEEGKLDSSPGCTARNESGGRGRKMREREREREIERGENRVPVAHTCNPNYSRGSRFEGIPGK